MMTIKDFIKSYPVLSYFIITFAISWGGFILVVGSNGFSNTNWQADPSFPFAVMVMLAGPSVAGLLMTSIVDGKAGLSSLLSRLLKWRVGVQWYGIAILTAPVLSVIALFALSIKSPIFTADDKAAVVLSGIMAGLTTVFEEIGWTGFVVPRLRLRHSIFSTGLVVGVIWGAWHLLQQVYISGTYTGEISLILYLSVAIFNTVAGLTAYRVLLVWIYDRTSSLLLVWLMHASLTACNIFIFRPETSGVPFLIFGLVFTALQWILVAGIFVFKRGRLSNGVQSSRRFDHGGM
jgi:membrane protease YdiL (CAAX protease family)